MAAKGAGTKEKPWELKTPSGLSAFQAYRDEGANPPAVVVTVGSTTLQYQLRCLDDLHAMLEKRGDWMPLGSADEQTGGRRHGRGVGTVRGQSRRRLVRPQEGASRAVRELRPAGPRGPRSTTRLSSPKSRAG